MGLLDAPVKRIATPVNGIATRAHPALYLSGATLSDGIVTGGNFRLKHKVIWAAHNLQIAYTNWYNLSASEGVGPNAITVRASIEWPVGTYIPVWFNGLRDVTIQPGQTVWCDVLGIDLPFGGDLWTRSYVTVASVGMKWPLVIQTVAVNGEGATQSAAEVDKTTSTTIAVTNTVGFGPSMIRATPRRAGVPVVALIGDSVMAGHTVSPIDNTGWVVDALGDTCCTIQLSYPGGGVAQWTNDPLQNTTAASVSRRKALLDGATHAMVGLGRNQLNSVVKENLLNIWNWCVARGMVPRQTTITPLTTSTDAWATVENQTVGNVAGVEDNRVALNTWLRDGAPIVNGAVVATGTNPAVRIGQSGHPLVGYVDTANAVESALNSGKWKAGYTGDGTHPNATAEASMRALISISMFGPAASA